MKNQNPLSFHYLIQYENIEHNANRFVFQNCTLSIL